jgi:peptidoglycan/xylan/chitin deacetylase (PgdA/CDA1 family)
VDPLNDASPSETRTAPDASRQPRARAARQALPGLRPLVRAAGERALLLAPSRAPRGGRLVLAYHNVVADAQPCGGDGSLHLPVEAFAQQLRLVRREAQVVSLATLLAAPPGARDRLVAVTFDDAYASALTVGVPCCAAHDIPSTVFVAPGLLGGIPAWDRHAAAGHWAAADRAAFLWQRRGIDAALPAPPWTAAPAKAPPVPPSPSVPLPDLLERCRLATADALLAAVRAGCGLVALGNHSWRHANLGALDTATVHQEVRATAAWLAAHAAAAAVPVLAYPYGIPPRDADAALADAGVTQALCVAGGWMTGHDARAPWHLPRWNVPAGISPHGFRLRLRGWLAGGTA